MFEFGRRLAAQRRKHPQGRHHHPARVRAADAAGVRRLLRAAGDGRQRDDAPHDHPRAARRCSSSPDELERLRDATRRSARPPPRRCCAGRRRCTTSAAPPRSTPSSAGTRDQGGRQGHDLVRLGQPRRDGLRGARPLRRRRARRTRTWPSGPAASTTAWARTWPRWRSGSRSRSCSRAPTTIELAGPAGAAALELLQRDQAPAGAGDAVIALRRWTTSRCASPTCDEAAARWALQFGLTERARRGACSSCDDEPYALELIDGRRAGLRPRRLRARARRARWTTRAAHLDGARRRRASASRATSSSPTSRATRSTCCRTASPRRGSSRTPARRARMPVGHPRKLGHVNFLTGAHRTSRRTSTSTRSACASPTGSATAACGCTSAPTTT